MGMNGMQMGTEVWQAVNAMSDEDIKDGEKLWQTACTKIIEHIQNNAVVHTTGQATGVSTGLGTAPTTAEGDIS